MSYPGSCDHHVLVYMYYQSLMVHSYSELECSDEQEDDKEQTTTTTDMEHDIIPVTISQSFPITSVTTATHHGDHNLSLPTHHHHDHCDHHIQQHSNKGHHHCVYRHCVQRVVTSVIYCVSLWLECCIVI